MERYDDGVQGFGEATMDEQMARFVKIRDLLRPGSPLLDFIENTYKYPEVFSLEGKNNGEKSKIFGELASFNFAAVTFSLERPLYKL